MVFLIPRKLVKVRNLGMDWNIHPNCPQLMLVEHIVWATPNNKLQLQRSFRRDLINHLNRLRVGDSTGRFSFAMGLSAYLEWIVPFCDARIRCYIKLVFAIDFTWFKLCLMTNGKTNAMIFPQFPWLKSQGFWANKRQITGAEEAEDPQGLRFGGTGFKTPWV